MEFKQEDLREKIEKSILFPTCTAVDKKIYAFTSLKRLPIMIDLHTGKITLLENVKGYDGLFVADYMLSIGDNIFVLELNGNRVLKYSISKNTCQYFSIDCRGEDWDNYAVLAQYGKHLYVVPRYTESLVKVELESGKVQKDRKLHLKLNTCYSNKKQEGSGICFWCGCQFEKLIYLFPRQGNFAATYDMEQEIWQEYELSIEIADCVHVIPYDGNIYILSSEGRVYQWSITNNAVELLTDCSEKEMKKDAFLRIAVTDKKIYLLPSLGEDILTVDLDTRQIEKYESYPSDFRYCGPKEWSKYHGYCEDNNNYYFSMRSMNYMLSLNKRSGEVKWIKLQPPLYKDIIKMYIKYNRGIVSEKECDINNLLNYINNGDIKRQNEDYIVLAEKMWEQVKS